MLLVSEMLSFFLSGSIGNNKSAGKLWAFIDANCFNGQTQ